MSEKLISKWKKVFENDLSYIVYEMKEYLQAPAVIILDGPMGSGKTTFAKEFIGDGETFSPSYSIISESSTCLHADLDRIEEREEITHLELGLHLEQKNFFLVEWGGKFLNALEREVPDAFNFYLLKIEILSDEESSEKDFRNYSFFELEV